MPKILVLIYSLLVQQIGWAHPGHHHGLDSPAIHSLFSWEQLVYVAVLAIIVTLYLRSR
jgi:hypothetical protein